MFRTTALALAATLALGVPAVMAGTTSAPVAAEHMSSSAPTAPAASSTDATNYASREINDKKAADYQGGSVVVIGLSGGALIIVILLLLILL